jgi:hypothetical protein
MDKYFKISEIKRNLQEIEKNQPHKKYISVKELAGNLKEVNRALVYNLDEIISDLRASLGKTTGHARTNLYTEPETSKILKVNRTTLYYWRTHKYIRYAKLNNNLIRYKLTDLLEDLETLLTKSNNVAE